MRPLVISSDVLAACWRWCEIYGSLGSAEHLDRNRAMEACTNKALIYIKEV